MTQDEKIIQIKQRRDRRLSDPHADAPDSVKRAAHVVSSQLYDERLNMHRMKRQCRIDGHNFAAVFARWMGCRPKRYINRQRIETGKQLLLKTEASISRIAFEVGFGRVSTFSKCFKRQTGQSPSRWRRTRDGR